MPDGDWTTASLWLAVMAAGIYHGLNPGMGWPLAVSAALMSGKQRDLAHALGLLAVGHFLAMTVILLPFALLSALVFWQRPIRLAAALIVIGCGLYLLVNRRHPRLLARIPPSRLALWSFLIATAHGAGLMLLPIYLGLCSTAQEDAGHRAAASLMGGNLATAFAVSFVHTLAMIAAGGAAAFAVYRWLGLKVLTRGWFNLELVWAFSLVAVGALAMAGTFGDHAP